MGMTVGGRGGPVSDPNIVPLIDVLLVLIIICMVITPTKPTGLITQIPQPSSPPQQPEAANPLTVVVQVTQGERLGCARPAPIGHFQGARREGGLHKGR